jgi:hypothetical protein
MAHFFLVNRKSFVPLPSAPASLYLDAVRRNRRDISRMSSFDNLQDKTVG